MSLIAALILGLIQGATEFLPISSSAHLQIARFLLSMPTDSDPYFDLICHAGTILAASIYLRKEILKIFTTPRQMLAICLALFPLIPAYFFIKLYFQGLLRPEWIGYGLLTTSAFLALSSYFRVTPSEARWKWQDMLCIGMMQTLAFLPGVSRSGSTMAAARFCGWPLAESARFSFLLAIPTILGGQFLETLSIFWQKTPSFSFLRWDCFLIGFISAFLVGFFTIRKIFQIYASKNLLPFAIYCAGLGVFALRLFHA